MFCINERAARAHGREPGAVAGALVLGAEGAVEGEDPVKLARLARLARLHAQISEHAKHAPAREVLVDVAVEEGGAAELGGGGEGVAEFEVLD